MNRLIASLQAFIRDWKRRQWLKARRSAIKDPFTN